MAAVIGRGTTSKRKSPTAQGEVTEDLLRPEMIEFAKVVSSVPRHSLQVAYVARILKAASLVLAGTSTQTMATALTASSDLGVLARALSDAASSPAVAELDPTAELIAAGVERKNELIEMAGGLLSAKNAGLAMGISRQAIEKRRKSGGLIGIRAGGEYRYPAFQFRDGALVLGLDDVLKSLPIKAEWMRLEWLLTASPELEGVKPLEALEKGRTREVIETAAAHGDLY